MSSEPFFFFLPNLYQKGLIEDDRNEYALVTYPRQVISEACRIIGKDYSTRIDSLDIGNKKRIKTISEHLAVILSLSVNDVPIMATARTIYRNWMNNLSMFGDLKRQNKFLRRILKQLSLPFAFNDAENQDVIKGSFYTLLIGILTDYHNAHITHGLIFEKETWILLIKILIGICDQLFNYDFLGKFPKADASKLRQKSFDVCLSIVQLSGLADEDVWKIFQKYCSQWSRCYDFIKVWENFIRMLFSELNNRIYKHESNSKFIQGGVYSTENPLSDSMLKFLFFKYLGLIDISQVQADGEIFQEFANTFYNLAADAQTFANCMGKFLQPKYSSGAFLKLFGRYITVATASNDKYDEGKSINVSTIISIISGFEIDHKSEIVNRLLAYIINLSSTNKLEIIASFVANIVKLYRYQIDTHPLISYKSLQMIDYLCNSRPPKMFTKEVMGNSLISTFISSVETLRFLTEHHSIFTHCFDLLWKNTESYQLLFKLLCFSHSYNLILPVVTKIKDVFNSARIKYLQSHSEDVPGLASCIEFIGTFLRFKPEVIEEFIDQHAIYFLFATLMESTFSKMTDYNLLIIAAQNLLLTAFEYAPSILNNRENINIICEFITYVDTLCQQRVFKSEDTTDESEVDNAKLIKGWNEMLSFNLGATLPCKDLYARKLNAYSEVNEEAIIKKFNVSQPKVSYFSIGDHSLVSFIESNEDKDKMILFIRSVAGKAIFKIKDDYHKQSEDGSEPHLSNEIKKVDPLPPAENTRRDDPNNDNDSFFNLDLVPHLSYITLEKIDNNISLKYKDSFKKWLDWEKYGFCALFNTQMPYQRSRASDFVSTFGFLNNKNTKEIRTYSVTKNPEIEAKLKSVIKQLDDTDSLAVLPLVIDHILPNDEEIVAKEQLINNDYIKFENDKTHNRMTQNLLTFLREIGEPMTIPDGSSDIIPPLRTTAPTIPSFHSIVAILSPAMASDVNGARSIFDLGDKALVRIFFNESDLKINLPESMKNSKQFIFSISPSNSYSQDGESEIYRLYYVKQLATVCGFSSPFTTEQAMCAESIGFNLAMIYEQAIKTHQLTKRNLVSTRKDIIRTLFDGSADPSLGGTIADQF